MKTRTAHLLLLSLVLGVVGCDHATKGLAEHELRDGPPVELVAGAVDLQYAQNRGVAFNTERVIPARWRSAAVFAGGFLALGLVCAVWVRRYRTPSMEHVAYAMIVGGALGNLLDRVIRGYVVDFVHIHGWPIFNVADVALGGGVALLLVHTYRAGRSQPPTPVAPA